MERRIELIDDDATVLVDVLERAIDVSLETSQFLARHDDEPEEQEAQQEYTDQLKRLADQFRAMVDEDGKDED